MAKYVPPVSSWPQIALSLRRFASATADLATLLLQSDPPPERDYARSLLFLSTLAGLQHREVAEREGRNLPVYQTPVLADGHNARWSEVIALVQSASTVAYELAGSISNGDADPPSPRSFYEAVAALAAEIELAHVMAKELQSEARDSPATAT